MGLIPASIMSAMQLVHGLREKAGNFLILTWRPAAPESDDNRRYKSAGTPGTWKPAGKSGAIYREAGKEKQWIMSHYLILRTVKRNWAIGLVPQSRFQVLHASLLHGRKLRILLDHCDILSSVLMENVIELALTDETIQYDTNGLTLRNFSNSILPIMGFRSGWKSNSPSDLKIRSNS
jgi:hypothetical protein